METALEEVTLDELLELAIENHMIDHQTSMPCVVQSFNADKRTVTVVPAFYRAVPDGNGDYVTEPLPTLSDIPVEYPRVQQFLITFPIAAGDYGRLAFCSRNLGAWRATGNAGDPGDLGTHNLDGAVFIPGLSPDKSSAQPQNFSSTNMIIGSDTDGNSRIEIKPSGGVNLGAGATKRVARKGDPGDAGCLYFVPNAGTAPAVLTYVPPPGPYPPPVGSQVKIPVSVQITDGSAHILAVD